MATTLNNSLSSFYTNAIPALKTKLGNTFELLQSRLAAPKPLPTSVLKVGDVAPDFTLTNEVGKIVSLYEDVLAKNKFAILVFYRGDWCPYCSLTLRAHNNYLAQYASLGARFIALTPQLPDQTPNIVGKSQLKFTVLSDVGCTVTAQYGILNVMDDDDKTVVHAFGHDFKKVYGDDAYTVPHPATFVIDSKSNKIIFSEVQTDIRKRTDPNQVIDVIKANTSASSQ